MLYNKSLHYRTLSVKFFNIVVQTFLKLKFNFSLQETLSIYINIDSHTTEQLDPEKARRGGSLNSSFKPLLAFAKHEYL